MAQIRGWIRWLSGTLRRNPWLPDVAQDARHGFRTLRDDPVFTSRFVTVEGFQEASQARRRLS
jgi:hypothetical protein